MEEKFVNESSIVGNKTPNNTSNDKFCNSFKGNEKDASKFVGEHFWELV